MHITHAKTRSRRANIRLASPTVTKAGDGMRLRHAVDQKTGMYRGKKILDLTRKADKAAKRRAAKAEKKGKS